MVAIQVVPQASRLLFEEMELMLKEVLFVQEPKTDRLFL